MAEDGVSGGARFGLWLAVATVFVFALAALAGWALWLDLDAAEREAVAAALSARGPLLAMLATAVPLALAALLRPAYAAYPRAARKLAEQLRLMHTANPGHRVAPQGGSELRLLAHEANQLAAAHQGLQQDVQARIDEAQSHLLQEKNRLAALMSELAQSVLVCNAEGRILLYNARATRLLAATPDGDAPVGLGRSVFGLLDRSPLLHALGQIGARQGQGAADPVAHFVTTCGAQLLRGQMAPVADPGGGLGGFVLMLEDITRSVQGHRRRDEALRQLTGGSRGALANIRAAAETLQQYPDMEAARRARFLEAIREEAQALSGRFESALQALDEAPATPWPLEDVQAGDLLRALERSLPAGLRLVPTGDAGAGGELWLSVDSYAVVQALAHLATRLAAALGLSEIGTELQPQERAVRLSLCWQGGALAPELLHEWEEQPVTLGAAGPAATLRQVLEQHGAELWSPPAAGTAQRLCLQWPAVQTGQPPQRAAAQAGRPVSYDFDLFGRPGAVSALDDRPLAELAFTVFDTEATGLSPADGDEIIAIGAVRVLNGRLLPGETFDRLVRPNRAVRREAQAVHGIGNELLQAQPPLEQVLPAFHRFAEDTVLVGHNVAFDMRLLELAQQRTGVVFGQPVLDTLLLSALVHPGHADAEHRLEAIAARLGVAVVGRHTALGDALVTAEIFIRLVPLLASLGIHSLRQAREASQKTLYARLEY